MAKIVSAWSSERCPRVLTKVPSTYLSCSFSDAESSASDLDGSLESASDAVVELYMYKPLASDHDSTSGGDDQCGRG